MRLKKIPVTTYQAGILQSRAYRALGVFMNKALAKHSLSMSQWAALGILHDENECRPSGIAKILAIKPPVATRLLNALVNKGLAIRNPHVDDNRGAVIQITLKGSDLVALVERELRSEMRKFLSDISNTELVR
jgi:DNA-binding MarR family transcriptional regulator